LGVEIRQYVASDGGMRTLLPRRVGQTAQAAQQKRRASAGKQRDEESFFADLAQRAGAEAGPVARRILEWGHERGLRIFWSSGAVDGSLTPALDSKDTGYWLATVWTYGRIEFAFQSLRTRPPFDDEVRRRGLLDRLNQIPGITVPADAYDRRPAVPLASIAAAGSTDEPIGFGTNSSPRLARSALSDSLRHFVASADLRYARYCDNHIDGNRS
jgi:hypothetical protein